MPAPFRQNGTGVTAEIVSFRKKESYRHEPPQKVGVRGSQKASLKGGNSGRGPKLL
jgi:hypothetical protein